MTPQVGRVRRSLRTWYRKERRDLPWRRTNDPYAIWISEIMLQQTRVDTVRPYFARFIGRFPSVHALAAASLDDVLGLWAGLGYYARARNLHAAARKVVELHGGIIPEAEEDLLALPGVGRYTAGAIRSIAFGSAAPILDGNVMRVLTRVWALDGDPRKPPLNPRLWALAASLAEGPAPGEVNQAVMELGALVCHPRTADCHRCPLSEQCAGRAAGEIDRLPALPRRSAVAQIYGVAAVVRRAPGQGELLLVQRPHRGLLGGLWELPGGERQPGEEPAGALERAVRERLSVSASVGERLGSVTHVFTHRRLELTLYEARLANRPSPERGPWRWTDPAGEHGLALSRLTEKALAAANWR